MRLGITLLVVSIFFCTSAFVVAEQTDSRKQIQVQALLIKAPDSVLKEIGISADLKKMPDREKLLVACAKTKNIDLFAYPTVDVLNGISGSSNVTQPVQYIEKSDDGGIAVKTERVGSIFEVIATTNNDDIITLEINLIVSKLKGRLSDEKIQLKTSGEKLDMGYPIIDSARVRTTVRVKNGEVVLLNAGITGNSSQISGGVGGSSVIESEKKEIILLTAKIL